MKNICFLVSNINPLIGGTERVTQTIAQGLREIDYHTFFIFTNADNDSINIDHKLKIDYSADIGHISSSMESFILNNRIKVLIVVNRVFQSKKYQGIFSYLKQKTGVKLIISLHAAPDNWTNKNKWGIVLGKVYFKELIKKILFKFYNPHVRKVVGSYLISNKYLLLSQAYIPMFEQTYKIKDTDNKLIAIPNPCPFKDNYDATPRENIVLVVSRMQEDQKRIYCMLKIWALVYKKHPKWSLVIVGDGPDLNTYKGIAKNLQNIVFEGHSSCVQDYYKRSKIFAMTSIWEGLPMTLIEAIHYGCVPIAFDSFAAVYDIIDNGKSGYIIPNNDVEAFSNELSNMMANEEKLKGMSDKLLSTPNMFQINDIISEWDRQLSNLIR